MPFMPHLFDGTHRPGLIETMRAERARRSVASEIARLPDAIRSDVGMSGEALPDAKIDGWSYAATLSMHHQS